MADRLQTFADQEGITLPEQLVALVRALPKGADLGTVRLLSEEEIVTDAQRGRLSASLLPIADAGVNEAFALYVPPERAAATSFVCAVSRETGVYAPLSSDLKGFAAWLLLLRRAQASLPAGPGFAVSELMADTEEAARGVAKAMGLESLLTATVEPDPMTIAANLADIDKSSPYGLSTLARIEEDPAAALKKLGPALTSAAFSVGLLEQAGDLLLTAGDGARAARSIASALARLEPNLQTAPYKLDEPDEESGDTFEPFYVGAAFRFLQEHSKELPQSVPTSTPYLFLQSVMGPGGSCAMPITAEKAIDESRRKMLSGDMPGGRWILHLAYGELFQNDAARRPLAEELSRAWELTGSRWYASRFRKLSA